MSIATKIISLRSLTHAHPLRFGCFYLAAHFVAEVTKLFCHWIGVHNIGQVEDKIADLISEGSDYEGDKQANKDAEENEGDHKTRLTQMGR